MSAAIETDVLVVGFGAAGANAAIAAHDAGARVLVVEKMARGGGNSALCAGALVVPRSLEAGIAYYRALAGGTVDEEMVHAFAAAMSGIPALLERLGFEYRAQPPITPTYPGLLQDKLRQIHVAPTGEGAFRRLQRLVARRGIEVLCDTAVERLLRTEETRAVVSGALARRHGQTLRLHARRAVVLASGGYGASPALLASYNLPGATGFVFPWGAPGNTGDGIRLACEAGAALWHTAALEWGRLCAAAPSRHHGTAVGVGLGRTHRAGGYLFVNREGRRFMAEDAPLSHCKDHLEILRIDAASGRLKHLPAWLIFDQAYRARGPVAPTAAMFRAKRGGAVGHALVGGVHDWSADNGAEIDDGWVLQAPTLAALAARIGVHGAALEASVGRYNRLCRQRDDADFGRAAASLAPVGAPPYYAVELGLTLVNTQGGPRRDGRARVLDHDGHPVPRLYSAGELGSFFGHLYQIGSNFPEAWAFGEIAGRMAAAEAPLAAPGAGAG